MTLYEKEKIKPEITRWQKEQEYLQKKRHLASTMLD
jgi:hypothetical protein